LRQSHWWPLYFFNVDKFLIFQRRLHPEIWLHPEVFQLPLHSTGTTLEQIYPVEHPAWKMGQGLELRDLELLPSVQAESGWCLDQVWRLGAVQRCQDCHAEGGSRAEGKCCTGGGIWPVNRAKSLIIIRKMLTYAGVFFTRLKKLKGSLIQGTTGNHAHSWFWCHKSDK